MLFILKNNYISNGFKTLRIISGPGSVGKVATNYNFEITSLDKDMKATIQTDILNWNYKTYPTKYFDVIWASPPCAEYSIAKTTGIRKIEQANQIVKRVLEIISYFNPTYYMIENPQTGLLKNQTFMIDIPFNDLDYCKYGMLCRKRTRIWNNLNNWIPRPLCKKDCGNVVDNKHIQIAQRTPIGKKESWGNGRTYKQEELYIIPEPLVIELIQFIVNNL